MQDLSQLRQKIDKVDTNILALVRERMAIVKNMRAFKKKHKIQIIDKKRERIVLLKAKTPSEKAILKKIIAESKKAQRVPKK
jgi:chorismate mutase/prephenate dehydratase